MAKPKTPFFSLGAQGTIADTLTLQKRGRDTIARAKPIPAYRYTLPQAYQRWLYQDYAYLWTQQSEVTKRQYTAAGGRFHLTGFQYWMKYNLANLPDIAGMWHLDKISNSSVIDFSKNLNHGTVYGASLVDGVIDKALLFDGIDDYVNCTNNPSLDLTTAISVEFWFRTPQIDLWDVIVGKQQTSSIGSWEFQHALLAGQLRFILYGLLDARTPPNSISPDTWYHVAGTFDGTTITIYLDGVPYSVFAPGTMISLPNSPVIIGMFAITQPGNYSTGEVDHLIIYNRAEDATEIKRHSERRYPV